MNFLQLVYEHFKNQDTELCLKVNGQNYSYSFIRKRIGAIQEYLSHQCDDSLVGIEASNEADTYAAILATWFCGKGFVPLHPNYPDERISDTISQAGIKVILSASETVSGSWNSMADLVQLSELENSEVLSEPVEFKGEQIFCILFTSGSTGKPKGVPMTASGIDTTMDSFFALGYGLSMTDRFLQIFELTFDMSMLSYLPAFMLGASVYTVGSNKIKYFEAARILKEDKITFAAMVPSTLSLLQPYFSKINLPELKYSVLGGEPFYEHLAKDWSRCIPNGRIVNISGPTEITMACMGYMVDSTFQSNKTHNGILAFGFPWKNTKAIILNEYGEECAQGVKGELCFAGNNVMKGYLGMKAENKRIFITKRINGVDTMFYKTGDMAFVDKDGTYHTCGRADKQVKVQGYKVELEEIEYHSGKWIKSQNVFAFVLSNSNLTQQIILCLEGVIDLQESLLAHLKTVLPYYMIPSKIVFLDKFKFNANGKIDRPEMIKYIKEFYFNQQN